MNFILRDNTILNTRELVSALTENKTETFELTCYRVYGLDNELFKTSMYHVYVLDQNHLCIIAYLNEFQVNGSVSMKISEIGSDFGLKADKKKSFDSGTYMLMLYYGNEKKEHRKKEYTSLTSIFISEEFIHNYCFNIEVLNRGYIQTTPIDLKQLKQKIIINNKVIKKIVENIHLIKGKHSDEKERMMLSLRWYYKHLDQQIEDAFLTLWIAIEVLGDCDRSNISRIKKDFQKMYGMESNMAGQTFQIGSIQSLRGNLVHKGRLTKLDKLFIKYLRRVYWDLLNHKLNKECENYCLTFLEKHDFSVSNYL